jgi:hypothetical protein
MPLSRLIVYRLKLYLAALTRGGRGRVLRLVGAAVITVVFIAVWLGVIGIFRSLESRGEQGALVAAMIVGLMFHGLLLLAFVFDVAANINIFFLSSDLGLLMAAPLPPRRVFTLKYLEAMTSGSLLSLIIALATLTAYGISFGAGPLFYVVLVVALAAFLSIPVSVGTVVSLLVSRYVRVSRVKEILGVAGGAMALLFWILIQLVRPPLGQSSRFADLGALAGSLSIHSANPLTRNLPSTLAARSLSETVSGRLGDALPPLVCLLAIAGILAALSVTLAERMYLTGWARVVPAAGKKRHKRTGRLFPRLFSWLPGVERSIVTTTATLYARDPQQMMPVASLTVMMTLLPVIMGRSESGIVLSPALLLRSALALSFVGSMNMGIGSAAIDGRCFWMLLAAPVSAFRKMAAKLLVPVFFFAPLASLVIIGFRATGAVGWRFVPAAIWFSVCAAVVGGAAGLLIGITHADWEWDNPRRMLKVSGRLLMLAIVVVFFVVMMALPGMRQSQPGMMQDATAALGTSAVVGVGAVISVYLLLLTAARRLRSMEWKI